MSRPIRPVVNEIAIYWHIDDVCFAMRRPTPSHSIPRCTEDQAVKCCEGWTMAMSLHRDQLGRDRKSIFRIVEGGRMSRLCHIFKRLRQLDALEAA